MVCNAGDTFCYTIVALNEHPGTLALLILLAVIVGVDFYGLFRVRQANPQTSLQDLFKTITDSFKTTQEAASSTNSELVKALVTGLNNNTSKLQQIIEAMREERRESLSALSTAAQSITTNSGAIGQALGLKQADILANQAVIRTDIQNLKEQEITPMQKALEEIKAELRQTKQDLSDSLDEIAANLEKLSITVALQPSQSSPPIIVNSDHTTPLVPLVEPPSVEPPKSSPDILPEQKK